MINFFTLKSTVIGQFYLMSFVAFQDPATPIMEGISDLHNHIFFYLVFILIAVSWVFLFILRTFYGRLFIPLTIEDLEFRKVITNANNITHGKILEIVWTLLPSLVLILIVVPSFALLYSMDEVIDPAITLKVIGHQWYWSYEYSDPLLEYRDLANNNNTNEFTRSFDSYMVDTAELELGDHRLLEVDNQVILPIETHIRVIVTADDVLHSWAIPSLGIKIDAVPGRLSQVFIFLTREGTFYGQCSELCGVNHGFMPIVIKATTLATYLDWFNINLGSFLTLENTKG